ncbi:uncharacterized protein TNCV_2960881 [Trichonephila clavipes]|nr:uncharacterized protein TNCV_2960881 [Trichonephila clavipes]
MFIKIDDFTLVRHLKAQWYTQTRDKLHKAIKNKRPSMLWSGVIILFDIGRSHVAKVCVEVCKTGEVLEHHAYSRDLSPCDYHMFGPLKKNLMRQRFCSDDDVKDAVLQ